MTPGGRPLDSLSADALAAGAGDRAALARFVRATQADVWRLCAYLVDTEAADDLTQEVYERALRGLSRFRGDSAARTWLLSIARRTCVDTIRARTRQRRREEQLRSVAVERSRSVDDLGLDLDDAIDRLADDRRAAFVLTQLLGYRYEEAAEILGCPVGTIRSRVSRARIDLLGWLEVDGPAGSADGRGA